MLGNRFNTRLKWTIILLITLTLVSCANDSPPSGSNGESSVATPPRESTSEPNTSSDAPDLSTDTNGSDESRSSFEDTPTEAPATSSDTHEDESVTVARPAELRIDKLDIASEMEFVGVTDEGNMDVPAEWENVAWFEPGTIPGNPGNAVVAGHYDSDTGPAIFYRLEQLEPDDEIKVITEDGDELIFTVTEVDSVHIDNAPLDKVFGSTSETNLNLITCDGTWNAEQGEYDSRLIVYSTLVES